MSPLRGKPFAELLVRWQQQHGRQALPWQHTGDAYKVWLSEVMLQQTQVTTVLAYYARFLQAFPTVAELAAAPEQEVMQLWAGLGYYTRARNLHACAKQVVARFGGQFPRAVADLESLPGIGLSTAGAIASLAFGGQAPILDGNVKRVFCRYYGIEGYPEQTSIKKSLWAVATENVPLSQPGIYNQALMDLGATRCVPRNPLCSACPLMERCVALRKGMVGLLPTPKPRKARPEQYFISLIVQDEQDAVWLELQADKGVWQSLWMPPFLACSKQADVAELKRVTELLLENCGLPGLRDDVVEQLPGLLKQNWLVHELTHRKMHFKVLRVKVAQSMSQCFALDKKPVPSIVHKLLSANAAMAQQNTLDF